MQQQRNAFEPWDGFVNHVLLQEQMHYIEVLASHKIDKIDSNDHIDDLKRLGLSLPP